MTLKDYLSWLDSEIEKYTEWEENEFYSEQKMNNYLGQIQALERAKEKFLTIQFPSQLTENDKEE